VSIDGDKSFATRTEQELTGPQEGALTRILTKLNHLLQGHCEVVPSAVRVAVQTTKTHRLSEGTKQSDVSFPIMGRMS